jgi:hypothetical protein
VTWQSPTKPWSLCSPGRQAQLRKAWGAGNLRWKLDPSQALVYDQIYASHKTVNSSFKRIFCMDISRQSGKDFIMSTIAIETCLRRRFPTRIPYFAPTKDNVHELLIPTIEAIFADCPPELLPYEISRGTFRTNSPELNWKWGARIVLVGVDLHPDWLRGPATYAIMGTEPAFIDDFQALMEGVLMPQLLTQQDGFVVLGSTPPVSPGHPWSTKYIPEAKKRGMYARRTILDCPRLSDEQKQAAIEELGGMKATRVQRELFVEHVIESTLAVVPEFQEARKEIVTADGFDSPPEYRDTYVSMDPGFSHATGALFAWYDFAQDLVMIEGDFAVQQLNSLEVSRHIKAREWQLWGRPPKKPDKWTDEAWTVELALIKALFYMDLPALSEPVKSFRDGQTKLTTFRRVSDTDSRLIADLSSDHGIVFSPTEKDEAETALNAWRVKIQNKRYRIHPRCVNLITHLEQATWNKARTKLAESAGGGHFDCIPAGVYLNRNIIWGKNPTAPDSHSRHTHHIPRPSWKDTKTGKTLAKVFGRK